MPLLTRDMPTISEIEPGLYIGDCDSSSQLSTLSKNNITAIVSLANFESEAWSRPANRELVPEDNHMFVRCADSPTQDLLGHLADICDFIDKHIASKDNILVHCTAGVSRSATIVVAYLMRKNKQSLDSVLKQVKDKRWIEPSSNFMTQLQIWEAVQYEVWEDSERTTPKEQYSEFLGRRDAKLDAKAKAKHRRDGFYHPSRH
jgi:dual specificity phosphatase 12